MILSYDPVARELVVDAEDGRPRFEVPADRVVIKYYADGAVLFAELTPMGVTIGFHPDPGPRPWVSLETERADQWRVLVRPAK